MAAQSIVVNTDKIAHELVEGEVIIINLETGAYYHLVDAGVEAWQAIERNVTREQFVQAMASRCAGESGAAVAAVNAFLDELIREEIVVLRPGGDGAAGPLQLEGAGEKLPLESLRLSKHTNMSDLLLLDPIHDVDEQGWPSQRPAPSG
ncbi:MAG: PqqD family protein [Bryobacteraceae bacterium]|nr:PqqD family protein [Bryobacteraceae bacterium]